MIMDVPPARMMRAAQVGDILETARADSIWRCLSCLTCSARCPKSVNVSSVVDAFRQISIETNSMSPESAKIVEFQKAFLRNVRRNGRTNEVEMATDFEVRYFFRRFDVMNVINTGLLGTKMLKRGKMNFAIGSPVKDKDLVKRIFSKCDVKL
jgi:heterodisulfide reductase subunit C